MRKLFILPILLLAALVCAGGPTYYGVSGYTFVPDGFVPGDWKYAGFVGGEYVQLKNVRLYPKYITFRSVFFDNRLELSLSNTYAFVDGDGYASKRIGDGLYPVVPGFKWSIDKQQRGVLHWGYSVGAMFPYGAIIATTVQLRTPVLQPELTAAAGLNAARGYGMLGSRLQTADFSGKPLPLALTAELGGASSVEQLGETEEAFVAYGVELDLGRNLTLQGNFRKDPKAYRESESEIEKPNQNKEGKWSLRLEYHFNGIKSTQEGK
jgi:hypothetical protein